MVDRFQLAVDRGLRAVLDHPGATLTGVGTLSLVLLLGMLQLEIRTDGAAIHPTGNPVVEQSAADRYEFLEREQVIVLLTATADGPMCTAMRHQVSRVSPRLVGTEPIG